MELAESQHTITGLRTYRLNWRITSSEESDSWQETSEVQNKTKRENSGNVIARDRIDPCSGSESEADSPKSVRSRSNGNRKPI